MPESRFHSQLIKELKMMFPGSIVLKTDPGYIRGIPDLIIFRRNKRAALECKKEAGAPPLP